MDKKHRDRGENWTAEEKEIFINLMKSSVRITDCKSNDTNTNKRKQAEWYLIQKRFQKLTGKLRGVHQLKGFWRRTRMAAKKNVFQYRRALHPTTGGDEKPLSPCQEEQHIVEMCPTDFITDDNELDMDSDETFHKNEIIHDGAPKDRVVVDLVCASGPSQQEDTTSRTSLTRLFDIEVVATKRDCLPLMLERELKCEIQEESTPYQPQNTTNRTRHRIKTENGPEATIEESNIDIKEKTFRLLEEEHALKLLYQRQELRHQELRHKLEIDILMIEKEKKEWELKLLKK